MNESKLHVDSSVPLGNVEPHAPLLAVPPAGQLLYKIVSAENLLRSIVGGYLHFNRVDSYSDFPNADLHDGQQLPKDQPGNAGARFKNAPHYTAADYYDRSRTRTYACCFSLENSDFIWQNYANGSERGKICVVFEFGKLRSKLNKTLQPGNTVLEYEGNRCHQIFSVNYGIVEYVEWNSHQTNSEYLANPIKYAYLKDKQRFSEENEFRISLSAIGIGHFALRDGSIMQFPSNLQLAFDFRSAIADSTIQQILYAPDSDSDFLKTELHKLRIVTGKG
ncbi:MAG: hypothetical protein KZQ95_09150 [Candidatus Thiodiazotropha sp. (ex Epidulcina cf. delphinae)]|nr:hypothetical protein [Candidatus Thiodiazotropha sp. (ex Epidulcina cf. delphinae)]